MVYVVDKAREPIAVGALKDSLDEVEQRLSVDKATSKDETHASENVRSTEEQPNVQNEDEVDAKRTDQYMSECEKQMRQEADKGDATQGNQRNDFNDDKCAEQNVSSDETQHMSKVQKRSDVPTFEQHHNITEKDVDKTDSRENVSLKEASRRNNSHRQISEQEYSASQGQQKDENHVKSANEDADSEEWYGKKTITNDDVAGTKYTAFLANYE